MIKTPHFVVYSLALAIITCLTSCAGKLEKAKAEILFDKIESHLETPTDSTKDSITLALENYDLNELDSTYQKAFYYNAYNFLLKNMLVSSRGYLDLNSFLSKQQVIAKKSFSTAELIKKLKSYHDPRVLLCLDFNTTTSPPTFHEVLKKDGNEHLDSLCTALINDNRFIRVKKDVKSIYYPEHYTWLLESDEKVRAQLLKYHQNKESIQQYQLVPYPFSYKLRN